MQPDGLDRGIELDLAAIDRESPLREQHREIARRYRAIELTGFRGLAQHREGAAVELPRDLFRLASQLEVARLELRFHGFEFGFVLLRGAQRFAFWQQEIAGIAVLDAHDVADLTELGHAFEQNHFHRWFSIVSI